MRAPSEGPLHLLLDIASDRMKPVRTSILLLDHVDVLEKRIVELPPPQLFQSGQDAVCPTRPRNRVSSARAHWSRKTAPVPGKERNVLNSDRAPFPTSHAALESDGSHGEHRDEEQNCPRRTKSTPSERAAFRRGKTAAKIWM